MNNIANKWCNTVTSNLRLDGRAQSVNNLTACALYAIAKLELDESAKALIPYIKAGCFEFKEYESLTSNYNGEHTFIVAYPIPSLNNYTAQNLNYEFSINFTTMTMHITMGEHASPYIGLSPISRLNKANVEVILSILKNYTLMYRGVGNDAAVIDRVFIETALYEAQENLKKELELKKQRKKQQLKVLRYFMLFNSMKETYGISI